MPPHRAPTTRRPGRPRCRSPGPPGRRFPAGATTSMSSRSAPAAARRERSVGERRERLHDPDERDPRSIVGVAVAVRVDGRFEPGEHLVGAPVDRHAAVRVGLPAGDADGEQRGARSDAVQTRRPADADDEPGELRARAARAGPGCVGFCSAEASLPGSTTSIPGSSRPWRNGWRVSTPVSSSATVTPVPSAPGSAMSGSAPAPRREDLGVEDRVRTRAPQRDRRRAPGIRPQRPGRARARAGCADRARPRSRSGRGRTTARGGPAPHGPRAARSCAAVPPARPPSRLASGARWPGHRRA